jgi:hypothetical protein
MYLSATNNEFEFEIIISYIFLNLPLSKHLLLPYVENNVKGPTPENDVKRQPQENDIKRPHPENDVKIPPQENDVKIPPPENDVKIPPPGNDLKRTPPIPPRYAVKQSNDRKTPAHETHIYENLII